MLPKIKLAFPYLSKFKKGFQETKDDKLEIIDAIEVKKIKDLNLNFLNKEIILHLSYGLVNDSCRSDFKKVENVKLLKKINYLSLDLGPACRNSELVLGKGIVPKSRILAPKEIISLAQENLRIIKRNFKGTIALENLDYRPTGAYEFVTEPELISSFLKTFGLNLLLDLAHAKVTASYRNQTVKEYLKSLPLSKVWEIHFSRTGKENGYFVDAHRLPKQEDYQILAWVLRRTKPQFLVIEFFGNDKLLYQEYRKLKYFLQKL